MGKRTNLTREKADRSGVNLLRAAIVEFERAPQGTREQATAFERILRTLASNRAKGRCTEARQDLRHAA
jgi:hypothetical protein